MGYPRKKTLHWCSSNEPVGATCGQAHKYVPMNLCQILRSEFFNSISMLKTKVILLELIHKVSSFSTIKIKAQRETFKRLKLDWIQSNTWSNHFRTW